VNAPCDSARHCCESSVIARAVAAHGAGMKFEVIESGGEWIVRREGDEVARFAAQDLALGHVADELRKAEAAGPASLAMRYERRSA
jgi:hypothetical protein